MEAGDLQNDECPEVIRKLVRNDKDIDVYDYVTRGFNGEVYFGKRKKIGDDVVLKFYIAGEEFDSSEEAVILRAIEHPNILRIHDLRFVAPKYAYFLSPKISGGDLQGLIDSDEPIPTSKALELVSGILVGLTELHSKHSLVHRDLKPGNILVDTATNTPIIADLGSVKKIDEADGHVTASKATPVYLPPEAVVNKEYYFQSDIYQIGVLMYQVLGGFFPLHKPDKWLSTRELKRLEKEKSFIMRDVKRDDLVMEKVCKSKIADTGKLPFYLAQSFKRVLNRSLHHDYSRRFQSPSEFLTAIHSLMRQTPCYTANNDDLLVKHKTQKEYRIYKNNKDQLVIEKRKNGKAWRKDNNHNGDMSNVLELARVA